MLQLRTCLSVYMFHLYIFKCLLYTRHFNAIIVLYMIDFGCIIFYLLCIVIVVILDIIIFTYTPGTLIFLFAFKRFFQTK